MGRRCVAALCSSQAGKGVSLHSWPSDPAISRQWTKFAQKKRAWDGPTKHSVLCSKHFEAKCFDAHCDRMLSMGFGKGRKLLPDAVPTNWEDPCVDKPPKKPRKAAEKRKQARVSTLNTSSTVVTVVNMYA